MNLFHQLRTTREYLRLIFAQFYDFRRYCRHACLGWNRTNYGEGQLEGRMIANYHVIEKGLSMPEFRPFFGVPTVKALVHLVTDGECRFGWCNNVNHSAARKTLTAYLHRHQSLGLDLTSHFTPEEIAVMAHEKSTVTAFGGSTDYQHQAYFADSDSPFATFARSRHSCRHFDPLQKPTPEQLRMVIDIARYSPSVCNRQCWRVHSYDEPTKIRELLHLQGGNRGFGHTIPVVLVITASLNVFDGYKEHNQAYIDGGLFSMSLMYALHHQKLGCVPMCWLSDPTTDLRLRRLAEIPDHETVIMFMGVGVPASKFQAPISQKRTVDEIITFHGDTYPSHQI